MNTQIPRRLIVAAVLLTAVALNVRVAEAQYAIDGNFDLAWTLDPADDTALFPRGSATGARSVLTGMDFDGDGNLEFLFTTDETISRECGCDPGIIELFLYENTGDDTYEYVWHYTNTRATNSLPALTYGDIDGDGLWEIYLGIPGPPTPPVTQELLFIFEQDDQGVFPSTPTLTYDYDRDPAADFRPSAIQLADVDQDGNIEIITTSRKSTPRELVIMELVGDLDSFATFDHEFEAGETILGGGSIYDAFVVDFDDDGLNEIWVNTWDLWSMAIFEATGEDTYVLQADLNQITPNANDPGSHNAHDLLFYDIDGDSKLEGFFPMTDGVFYFLESNDDVSMITGADIDTVGQFGTISRGGAMGDIDEDGNMDFFANTHDSETVVRMEYMGGSAADSTSYEWTTVLDATGQGGVEGFYPFRVAADLDQDGNNELVLTNLDGIDTGAIIIILEHVGGGTAIEEGPTVLDGFTLHSNYPNPFSNKTTVQVELERPADVSVEVYDLTGRRVKTLMSGMTAAGSHEVAFESQSLPSGLYLIRFGTPSGTLTRTAMLVR